MSDFWANGAVKMLVDRDRTARVNSSVNHEDCAPQLDLDNICANKILPNKAVVVNEKPPDLFLDPFSPSSYVNIVNEEFLTSRSNVLERTAALPAWLQPGLSVSALPTRAVLLERPHPRGNQLLCAVIGKRCTPTLGPAKRALILSIVGVSGSEVRVPPAAIYGAARAVNSNGLSHRRASSVPTLCPPPQ
ncbi:unnamed protein product [Arctia plantaginis]|uniref:Uncharacterized protein n=1 Tax=Arctia plantaginis TaxID=874455 RepID=A0A8S0ZDC3_ARCPL|nr:unnamed protein product [Arctia plantaginis]